MRGREEGRERGRVRWSRRGGEEEEEGVEGGNRQKDRRRGGGREGGRKCEGNKEGRREEGGGWEVYTLAVLPFLTSLIPPPHLLQVTLCGTCVPRLHRMSRRPSHGTRTMRTLTPALSMCCSSQHGYHS